MDERKKFWADMGQLHRWNFAVIGYWKGDRELRARKPLDLKTWSFAAVRNLRDGMVFFA